VSGCRASLALSPSPVCALVMPLRARGLDCPRYAGCVIPATLPVRAIVLRHTNGAAPKGRSVA